MRTGSTGAQNVVSKNAFYPLKMRIKGHHYAKKFAQKSEFYRLLPSKNVTGKV